MSRRREGRRGIYTRTAAGKAAIEATDSAKSALSQASAIIAALPENLRFAGLLVLIGTVLVSIATIQFNGVSLF